MQLLTLRNEQLQTTIIIHTSCSTNHQLL